MQRFLSNPSSRAIAPIGGSPPPSPIKPRRHVSRKAHWVKRSTFNCMTGRWTGEPFEIDQEMVIFVTEYMATRGGEAVITQSTRADGSESRESFEVHVPCLTRVGRA